MSVEGPIVLWVEYLKSRHNLLRSLLMTIFTICTLSGCNVVSSTQEFEKLKSGKFSQKCTSGLGSYSLAYSTVTIEVKQFFTTGGGETKIKNVPTGSPTVNLTSSNHYPDNDHIYCLNFLESGAARDVVNVQFGTDAQLANFTKSDGTTGTGAEFLAARKNAEPNGLLASVISRNIDQTGVILRKIVRALFTLLSGNSNLDPGRSAQLGEAGAVPLTVAKIEFDPFDPDDILMVNRRLEEYGVCITLREYTYHSTELSAQRYCNNPSLADGEQYYSRYLRNAKKQGFLVKQLPKGIYYRPRQDYPLNVYVKDDPGYPGAWQLRKTAYISSENLSPVLSLGVNRAAFAEKRLILAFDNGNLIDYCMLKGSEVAGALEVPLEIIYGIVALPGNTIKAQVDLASGKQKLLKAQSDLLGVQNRYIKYLTEENKADHKVPDSGANLTAKTISQTTGGASFGRPQTKDKDGNDLSVISSPDLDLLTANAANDTAEKNLDNFCNRLQKSNLGS